MPGPRENLPTPAIWVPGDAGKPAPTAAFCRRYSLHADDQTFHSARIRQGLCQDIYGTFTFREQGRSGLTDLRPDVLPPTSGAFCRPDRSQSTELVYLLHCTLDVTAACRPDS